MTTPRKRPKGNKTQSPTKARSKRRTPSLPGRETPPWKQDDRSPEGTTDTQEPRRINRILSLAGITSRRKADEFITSGRVTVNNRPVQEKGSRAVWGVDSIKVDGDEIPKPSFRTYLMVNKPFGYLCSLSDPEGRSVVTDLIRDVPVRVYPVGRLDFDSLGLLLLTNDGEWAHRLAHPRYRVPKTYKVTVAGSVSPLALEQVKNGVTLEDGFSGRVKASFIKEEKGKSIIRITITSGKRRIVRRIFEAVGYTVVHLIRTGFGSLELEDLKIGEYRHLETREVDELKRMVGLL